MPNEKDENVVFAWTRGYNNAVLNFMHNPKGEFQLYGDKYHEAGKTLLANLLQKRHNNGLECIPIVFVYRQALELNLKSIIMLGNKIRNLTGEPPAADEKKVLGSHSLFYLMTAVETIVRDKGWIDGYEKGCIENFEDCKRVAEDFNKIDSGYAFRYPIDKKKGNASVSHHFAFDIRIFAERLDPVIELMSGTAYALDAEYDAICEAISDARQEALSYADHDYYDGE